MLHRDDFILVCYHKDEKQELIIVQNEKVTHRKKVAYSRLKTTLRKMREEYNIRTILLFGDIRYLRDLRKELLEYFNEIIDYVRILN